MVLLWLSQPPLSWWPVAFVALVPLFQSAHPASLRPNYAFLWLVSAVYWLVSLQGLRHAHPLMFLCWLALGAYLAVYLPLFVATFRLLVRRGMPLAAAAAVSWVGWECIRNYAFTGISVLMLGHSMADVPHLIQIADLFGTYGVSFVLVFTNAAIFLLLDCWLHARPWRTTVATGAAAATMLGLSLMYGTRRLDQPLDPSNTVFALIQCDEQTEYQQDFERQSEIYQHYVEQSLETLTESDIVVDAVIWPESMLSGGVPWRVVREPLVTPPESGMTDQQYRAAVTSNRDYFLDRTRQLQRLLTSVNGNKTPELIGGCGVVDHGDPLAVYSGVLHIDQRGEVADWYGKTHLVMFGEYIPLIGSIPGLRSLIPEGMGLQSGKHPVIFDAAGTRVLPNLCIETAVERVVIDQLRYLRAQNRDLPQVIATVTNDAWFDHTSVVAHHLRCAQLVAVGARRPILSAANGGPTAMIDSNGRISRRTAFDKHLGQIVEPTLDRRASFYSRVGDLPAKAMAITCLVACAAGLLERRRSKRRNAGRAKDA